MSAEQIAGLVLLAAFIGFVIFLARNSRQSETPETDAATPPPPDDATEAPPTPMGKPAGKARRRP